MFKKYSLQILVVLLLIAIASALYLIGEKNNKNKPIQASINQTQGDATLPKLPNTSEIDAQFFPIRDWSVSEPEILAKSAIIINFKQNIKNNILFQKNIEQVLPIASLSKLMTAIITIENYNPEDIIKISKESIAINGDNGGLIEGEELKIKDLLYIMLIESSNDAAVALAKDGGKIDYNTFIDLMNQKAKEINLKNTHFVEPAGLDPKNESTVSELAILIEYALKNPLLADILKTPEATIYSIDKKFIHNLTSTNKLFGKIPILIGGKTGYTEEAGGCMITFSNTNSSNGDFIKSNYLITVILGSSQREEDTSRLIKWSQKAWVWQ